MPGLTWQWEISDEADNGFSSITTATSATFTPVIRDVGKYLRAKASYTDEYGSNNTATTESTSAVRAAGEPPSDSIAPEFPGNTAARSVAENTAAAQHRGPGHGH